MRILPNNSSPLFEQIADSVKSAIAAGVFRPGEAIPSIRSQATKLLINPNTIKRAYDELERAGLIESRAGLGMFVSAKAADLARDGVERSIKGSFVQGVRLGNAAHLERTRIDEVYRAAWSEAPPSKGNEQ